MGATISKGKTFGATETVTNAKLHQLVDSATIANIDQTNIVASSGLVVQSASQPSDTDALWNDTGNNVLKFLRSGSYKQLIDEISDQTVAGIKTFSGANIHNGVETFNEEIISGADADSPPVTNALYKDNIVKGWIKFNGTGTIAIDESFNVSSITDNGTGDYTVTWDRDFADVDYVALAMATERHSLAGAVIAGSAQIQLLNASHASADASRVMVLGIGNQ